MSRSEHWRRIDLLMGKFEILRGMDGHYYFVLKADNGLALEFPLPPAGSGVALLYSKREA